MGPNANLGQLRAWASIDAADESEVIAQASFRELDAWLSAGGALPADWNPCGLVWIEKEAEHGWGWKHSFKAISRKVPGAVYTLNGSAELWLLALNYPSGASVMWTAFTSEADARRNAQEHENGYR